MPEKDVLCLHWPAGPRGAGRIGPLQNRPSANRPPKKVSPRQIGPLKKSALGKSAPKSETSRKVCMYIKNTWMYVYKEIPYETMLTRVCLKKLRLFLQIIRSLN